MRKRYQNPDDAHYGMKRQEASGKNSNPAGEKQIRVPKNRKFAETPAEFVELLMEVLGNYLRTKGFDSRRIKLLLKIAGFFITEKTYLQYINLPAPGLYQALEDFINSKL